MQEREREGEEIIKKKERESTEQTVRLSYIVYNYN